MSGSFKDLILRLPQVSLWRLMVMPAVLSAVYTVQVAVLYNKLPDVIATHFDMSGNANDWMTKHQWSMFSTVFLWSFVLGWAILLHSTRGATLQIVPVGLTAMYWTVTGLVAGAFIALTCPQYTIMMPVFFCLIPIWPIVAVLIELSLFFRR